MQFEKIWSWLPNRFRIRDPSLCFNSKKDGYSLITFYQKNYNVDASILLIKTTKNAVFGVFTPECWEGDFYF